MISGAGRTLTYDTENRPMSIAAASGTTTIAYDYSGERVKKTAGGVTTTYVGSLYECISSGCAKYIFAGSSRIALKDGFGGVYYYHTDHLGSSTAVTYSSGTKVQDVAYYPYGSTRLNTGSVDVHHKFTGQELDDSTALYYYGARYYDPGLGRFISADSIGVRLSNPQTLNRYTYVLNNPLRYTDPTGNLECEGIIGCIGAGLSAAGSALWSGAQAVGSAIGSGASAAWNWLTGSGGGGGLETRPSLAGGGIQTNPYTGAGAPPLSQCDVLPQACGGGGLGLSGVGGGGGFGSRSEGSQRPPGNLLAMNFVVGCGSNCPSSGQFDVPFGGPLAFGTAAARGIRSAVDFFVTPSGTAVRSITPGGRTILPEVAIRAEERGFSLGTIDSVLDNTNALSFTDALRGTTRVFDPSITKYGGEGFNIIVNQAGEVVTGFPSSTRFINNPRFVPLQ